MNQEIKKKWLDALRSGEYKQGKRQLRSDNGNHYCCLGVLCDIHAEETGDEWLFTNGIYHYDTTFSVLPIKVQDWAGIPVPDPIAKSGYGLVRLSALNDVYKANFNEIADVIEKEL